MKLVELRVSKGLSQKALAKQVGVAMLTLFKWEHGEAMPTGDNLQKLIEVLGECPSDLHSRELGRPIK